MNWIKIDYQIFSGGIEALPTLVGACDGGVNIKFHESDFSFCFSLYSHNFSEICFCPFYQISLTNQPVRLHCISVPKESICFLFVHSPNPTSHICTPKTEMGGGIK